LIKPPAFSGSLHELTRLALQEDAESIHQAFQALTRQTQPSLNIVCLFDSPEGPRLVPQGNLIDHKNPESPGVVEALIRRSVTISRMAIVRELWDQPRNVPAWERNALLRHRHIILFDTEGIAVDFPASIRLDDELGIVFPRKESSPKSFNSVALMINPIVKALA
jgi:hypothetical protein